MTQLEASGYAVVVLVAAVAFVVSAYSPFFSRFPSILSLVVSSFVFSRLVAGFAVAVCGKSARYGGRGIEGRSPRCEDDSAAG